MDGGAAPTSQPPVMKPSSSQLCPDCLEAEGLCVVSLGRHALAQPSSLSV